LGLLSAPDIIFMYPFLQSSLRLPPQFSLTFFNLFRPPRTRPSPFFWGQRIFSFGVTVPFLVLAVYFPRLLGFVLVGRWVVLAHGQCVGHKVPSRSRLIPQRPLPSSITPVAFGPPSLSFSPDFSRKVLGWAANFFSNFPDFLVFFPARNPGPSRARDLPNGNLSLLFSPLVPPPPFSKWPSSNSPFSNPFFALACSGQASALSLEGSGTVFWVGPFH